MELQSEQVGPVRVVQLAGRLDNSAAEMLDVAMRQRLDAGDSRIVLDLEHLTYICSAGLRSLLVVKKRLTATGGAVVLSAVHPHVQEILDIAGFTAMFPIVPTRAEALARLATAPPA